VRERKRQKGSMYKEKKCKDSLGYIARPIENKTKFCKLKHKRNAELGTTGTHL
jgi:hypothetical protein